MPRDHLRIGNLLGGVLVLVAHLILHRIEQEWVVASLAQLHRDVVQRPHLAVRSTAHQRRDVLLVDGVVVVALQFRELDANHNLLAHGQLLDVVLLAAK